MGFEHSWLQFTTDQSTCHVYLEHHFGAKSEMEEKSVLSWDSRPLFSV